MGQVDVRGARVPVDGAGRRIVEGADGLDQDRGDEGRGEEPPPRRPAAGSPARRAPTPGPGPAGRRRAGGGRRSGRPTTPRSARSVRTPPATATAARCAGGPPRRRASQAGRDPPPGRADRASRRRARGSGSRARPSSPAARAIRPGRRHPVVLRVGPDDARRSRPGASRSRQVVRGHGRQDRAERPSEEQCPRAPPATGRRSPRGRAATSAVEGRLATMTPAASPARPSPHRAGAGRRSAQSDTARPSCAGRVPPQALARDRPRRRRDRVDGRRRQGRRLSAPLPAGQLPGGEVHEDDGQRPRTGTRRAWRGRSGRASCLPRPGGRAPRRRERPGAPATTG